MNWYQNFRYSKLHLFTLAVWGFIFGNDIQQVLAENLSEKNLDVSTPDVLFQNKKKNTSHSLNSLTSPAMELMKLTQLPNPIPPTPSPEPIPLPEKVPETPLDITPQSPDSPEQVPNIPGTITVEKFEFTGNTVFTNEELAQAVAEYIGKPITFAQLLEVETIVRDKYIKGCQEPDSLLPCYLNSGAYIPADQIFSLTGATITIKVVEGGLEGIEITGTRGLNQSYIRDRLEDGVSTPIERERLLEKLQILQLDPLIQNISAELAAGSRPNQSLLQIKVIESDPFKVEFFADNQRAPSVGSFRRGINIYENNLSGFGDSLYLEYINTDGSNGISTGYAAPINADNTTLSISGGVTETEVVEPPFDRIDIQGDSFNFQLGLRQPLLRTPTKELALGFTARRQESNTEVLGQNFALAAGADENGETRLSTLGFYQEYTHRDLQQVFAVRSTLNWGIGAFDATVNRDPLPDSRFFAWRGQGQYVRRLAQDTLLILRSDLQFATTNLVPLEQFSTGGSASVRGYRQDAILSDNGFFSSAEVRLPILRVEQVQGVLQVAPFVDFGVGWNSSIDPDPEQNTLMGLGVGLQWQMRNLTARFDYGIPLTDIENGDRTLQEDGIYFSINYSPF